MNVLDYVCTGPCMTRVFVELGNPLEAQLLDREEWKTGFPCIAPLCNGRLVRGSRVGAKEPIRLTATEFYRRVSGQGEAKFTDVRRIFGTKKVVGMNAEPRGNPEHVIVHNITFEDGSIMHFGVSRFGACVYKIEEPDHGVRVEAAAEGRSAHREEAGRNADPATEDSEGPRAAGTNDAAAAEQPSPEPMPAVSAESGVPARSATDERDGDHPNLRV